MFHSSAKILVFLIFSILFLSASTSDPSKARPHGLQMGHYSQEEVEGCFIFNQTLGVCFDVLKGSMKLLKTTGQDIVIYEKLNSNTFYYQVLDQGFIGHGSKMIYVPSDVPRVGKHLRAFLTRTLKHEPATAEQELLKYHYEEAVSELRYTPEIQLLERLTEALIENTTLTQNELLEPFRTLCLSLLRASNIDTPHELKALVTLGDESLDENDPTKRKRCSSLQTDPSTNGCLGMCGPGCSCWKLICGDCCFHNGCYQHDRCCAGHLFWSTYCLTPFLYSFSCSGYGAYPRCLYG